MIDERAVSIAKRLSDAGHGAWIVGGAVRDAVMGRAPKDWDVCTTASSDEVTRVFSNEKVFEVGKAFGIVTVVLDGVGFEVATLRIESGTIDGRHPETISFTKDIVSDLARRDFTMNAMAIDPLTGELIDPFEGRKDIADGVIRFVGDPKERVSEDKLRVLRAFRFASRYGFVIDEASTLAIEEAGDLDGVSMECVGAELDGILLGDYAAEALASMAKTGVLQRVIPELSACIECDHDSPWHQESWSPWGATVWSHTLWVVKYATENSKNLVSKKDRLALVWGALLHDIEKPSCKKFKT